MNSFESYFDVDHREQAKRKQQNCLLKSRTRLRSAPPWQARRSQGFGGQASRTCQTVLSKISVFTVGMVLGWMAGTITYCMIHIITK